MSEDEDLSELVHSILANFPDGALQAAQRGEPEELVSKIMASPSFTDLEQDYLIKLVRTQANLRGAMAHHHEMRAAMIAAQVEAKGLKRESAIKAIQAKFDISRTHAFRLLAKSETNQDAQAWKMFIMKTAK